MTKRFCDMCKKQLKVENVCNIKISGNCLNGYYCKTILDKEICEECAINMANAIDYECNRHILRPTVIVSKEAVDEDV